MNIYVCLGEYSSEGIIDPLDWELHLQTVAQQKKNQEEEAVRQRRRMVEHYKSKAAVQMRIHCYKKAAYLYTKVSGIYMYTEIHIVEVKVQVQQ